MVCEIKSFNLIWILKSCRISQKATLKLKMAKCWFYLLQCYAVLIQDLYFWIIYSILRSVFLACSAGPGQHHESRITSRGPRTAYYSMKNRKKRYKYPVLPIIYICITHFLFSISYITQVSWHIYHFWDCPISNQNWNLEIEKLWDKKIFQGCSWKKTGIMYR